MSGDEFIFNEFILDLKDACEATRRYRSVQSFFVTSLSHGRMKKAIDI